VEFDKRGSFFRGNDIFIELRETGGEMPQNPVFLGENQ
jgi:hypothetical protein